MEGKRTYSQLVGKYHYSLRTIQRKLDELKVRQKPVVALMNTTYWRRNFGVMLFKDVWTKENPLIYYVNHETNALYVQGVEELRSRGFMIAAIVCDGRFSDLKNKRRNHNGLSLERKEKFIDGFLKA